MAKKERIDLRPHQKLPPKMKADAVVDDLLRHNKKIMDDSKKRSRDGIDTFEKRLIRRETRNPKHFFIGRGR